MDDKAHLSCPRLPLFVVLLLVLLVANTLRAQLVADGATRTISNVTNTFGVDLIVGTSGSFTRLILSSSALLTNNGYAYIGFNAGANSNAAVIQDPNTRWLMSGSVLVGSSGSFNTLLITNGALMSSSNGTVGALFGANSNQVTVTGTGATWSNSTLLSVGLLGSFNSLLISNGGTVSAARVAVGNLAGATNNVLRLASGSLIAPGGLTVNSGNTVAGNGTVTGNVTNLGAISPGNSIGNLTVNGSLNLRAGSAMNFDIGGLVPAAQYDTVTVTNAVQFGGTLNLSLLNGFLPASGNSFTLMTYASNSGAFANATNGSVVQTTDRLRKFTVLYTPTSLVLTNAQPGDGVLLLTSIVPGNNAVTVRFQSTPTNQYEIQYSSMLTNWTVVSNAAKDYTTNPPGITTWIDKGTNTSGLPLPAVRFYRVRQLP